VLRALAKAGLSPCVELTKKTAAAIGADPALAAMIMDAGGRASAPAYTSLNEEREAGLAVAGATATAWRIGAIAEGLPACTGGEPGDPRAPSLDVLRIAAGGRTTVDLHAFAADYLARRILTKGLRCGGCAEDAHCPGIQLNHVRAAGYAALTPFPVPSPRAHRMRRRVARSRALLVQCDRSDLVYSHLLAESIKAEAARVGVALDVIATARPSVIAAELGAFFDRAPAGAEGIRVDDWDRAVAAFEARHDDRAWDRVVFNGMNEAFFGIVARCRARGWRPRITLYDAHAGVGADTSRPFFPTAGAAAAAMRDAGVRVVAPFDLAVLDEIYDRLEIPRDRLRPVLQWIDPAFFARVTARRDRIVLAPGSTARDWATLFSAAPRLEAPLHVAAGGALAGGPEGGIIHPRMTLREYRDLIAGAAVAVFPIGHANAAITSAIIAMAVGTPVVIGRSRFLSAYLREGGTCLTYEPGDAGGLTAKVNTLLDHPARAAALARSARAFVEKELCPARLLRALLMR
jgi:glycosyltransferase involved in cell wall biosynthesis